MLGIHDFPLFVAGGLLLNIVPGADLLYIAGRSASQGAKAGAIAALGIGAGCFVHVLTAIVGVSALVAASAEAFLLMKLAGAAYLVWLGIGLLRSSTADAGAATQRPSPDPPRTIFLQGFVTNALNPKVAVFFLAFLPQFVDESAPHPSLAMLILGIVFNVNGTLWNLGVAFGSAAIASKLRGAALLARMAKRAAGALFVFLGYRLATSTN
jgi:threonine/homoserine/homoserine lactone efflux protein